jgi:glycosyltransferase involved in cell wall biosynthesis
MGTPLLSIVVVFFNMRREAARTLYALSRKYQRNVEQLPYEVICVDNGSPRPLSREFVESFGPEFRYHFFETTSKSPAAALNFGVSQARGRFVTVMLDGAHIVTPRVLAYVAIAVREFPNAFVAVQSLALAPATEEELATWDQSAEDARLASVDWPRDGYELFRLTRRYGDDAMGWFGALFESSCLTLPKQAFEQLGRYDERFQAPGGGIVALDFFARALVRPELTYVVLLGESTFHQFHGGAATGAKAPAEHPWQKFHDEYKQIRGQDYQRVVRLPIYLGQFPPQALHIAEISARHGFAFWRDAFK